VQPWPPGSHPPRPGQLEHLLRSGFGDEVAVNPQPLPPKAEVAAYLFQAILFRAIRLHQYAQLLSNAKAGGSAAGSPFQRSLRIYDDGRRGTVPWQVLLQWLRHPPPWLDVVAQVVADVLVASRMGGELGKQLQAAATAALHEQLGGPG
jgi:hypothetical protein